MTRGHPAIAHTKDDDMSAREDRTVHAVKADNPRWELVRYNRAGTWWVEHADGDRRRLTLAEAVDTALGWRHNSGGTILVGKPGGKQFDARYLKGFTS